MKDSTITRPHLYPDLHDWPIYKLHQKREDFVQLLEQESFNRILEENPDIVQVLRSTVYSEKTRTRKEPWKVDPPNEQQWWLKTEKKLIETDLASKAPEDIAKRSDLLHTIIKRYAEEVVGSFKISTFLFARKFLTLFFSTLLSTAVSFKLWFSANRLKEQLIVSGQVDRVRKLLLKEQVVFAPTHFSNLDSLLIGYALDGLVGIPHSSFGAGLNLLNSGWVAYFINRFGAYRVDRRKKNPIYLEVLKSFSRLAIFKGINSTFFPGGTRSRSGHIEKNVKLGLLGTTVEAQRRLYESGSDKKVIVVPVVLSYHFVLEAKYLIHEYLKRTGKDQYLGKQSKQFGYRQFFNFLWQLFRSSSQIYLSLGQPLDVLGNAVDEKSVSISPNGTELNLKDYFSKNGQITSDKQREREYTKVLGKVLVDRFHRDNIVLSSHVVAFTCFNLLKQRHPDLDLYGVLRLSTDEEILTEEEVLQAIQMVVNRLKELEDQDQVKLSTPLRGTASEILKDGLKNIKLYHSKLPVKKKDNRLMSDNLHLLYYYHNRLEGYKLDTLFK